MELYIFESKSNIRAIGAGIAIWKRYWDILEEATDLESECTARGLRISPWSEGEHCSFRASGYQTQPYSWLTRFLTVTGPVLRKSDDPSHGTDFCHLPRGPRLIPRDVLLEILHKHANTERCHIQTNKKVVSWAQEAEKISVYFEDSTSIIVDLLIGADGVHSCVRQHLFKESRAFSEPHFSGQFAYRMSCSREEIEKRSPNSEALRGFKIVSRTNLSFITLVI